MVFYSVEKRFYSVEKPVGEQDKTHEFSLILFTQIHFKFLEDNSLRKIEGQLLMKNRQVRARSS